MGAFVMLKKKEEALKEEKNEISRRWKELNEREAEFIYDEEFGRVHKISPELILPNRSQPRRVFEEDTIIKLADSIRMYGILQPLTVRRLNAEEYEEINKRGDETDTMHCSNSNEKINLYELVAGERRLRAAKLISLREVPCIIIEADTKKSAELAIIENLQREDLNMFEQATAIASLIEIHKMTQEQVAYQLSASQSYVANKIRILRLDEEERKIILDNSLTERHARALLKIAESQKRKEALQVIIEKAMNVSATEEYIDSLCKPKAVAEAGNRKFIVRDMRIFYNTIDKAVETVKKAGIAISSQKKEENGFVELTIKIPSCAQCKH